MALATSSFLSRLLHRAENATGANSFQNYSVCQWLGVLLNCLRGDKPRDQSVGFPPKKPALMQNPVKPDRA